MQCCTVHKHTCWCHDCVIDSVFSEYFSITELKFLNILTTGTSTAQCWCRLSTNKFVFIKLPVDFTVILRCNTIPLTTSLLLIYRTHFLRLVVYQSCTHFWFLIIAAFFCKSLTCIQCLLFRRVKNLLQMTVSSSEVCFYTGCCLCCVVTSIQTVQVGLW